MVVHLTRRRWRGLNRIRIKRTDKLLSYLVAHFDPDPELSILTAGGVAAAVIVRDDLANALAATDPR